MKLQMKWLARTAALVVTLFAAGCDGATLTEPQLRPAAMEVLSRGGQKFVVAYEANPISGSVSEVIGKRGGMLGMGRHVLLVPRGAVDHPTLFTMTRAPEHPLRVELSAGENNVVGSAGFQKPLKLALSLGNAANVPDGEERKNAKILYFAPDGSVEPLNTAVYGSLVVADIDHFSLYGIGWP